MTNVTRIEVRNQMTKVIEIKDLKIPHIEETNETETVVEEKLIFDCFQKGNLQEQVLCTRRNCESPTQEFS